MTEERSIAVGSHGRYLVNAPSGADGIVSAPPLLVGFHGYAEDADIHFERLQSIPGSDRWLVVSVQGLHRFYRGRSRDVVASWMTRQNRDLMIADNLAYVAAVVDDVRRQWISADAMVFAGFSQGAAMAFRVAALSPYRVSGIVTVGGDVPPELDDAMLRRIPAALIGRGQRDEWYTAEKFAEDQSRLRAARTRVVAHEFDGDHEWTADFSRATTDFLGRLV
jgi:predicted esterase